MKPTLPEEFRGCWQHLTLLQRLRLLCLVLSCSIPNRLRRLRTTDVVVPAMLAQAVVFIFAILHASQTIFILATGNLVIVALAMLPSLMHSRAENHVSQS